MRYLLLAMATVVCLISVLSLVMLSAILWGSHGN